MDVPAVLLCPAIRDWGKLGAMEGKPTVPRGKCLGMDSDMRG